MYRYIGVELHQVDLTLLLRVKFKCVIIQRQACYAWLCISSLLGIIYLRLMFSVVTLIQ